MSSYYFGIIDFIKHKTIDIVVSFLPLYDIII